MQLLIAFVVGLATSGVVGLLVYLKQRAENREMERRLSTLLLKASRTYEATQLTEGARTIIDIEMTSMSLRHVGRWLRRMLRYADSSGLSPLSKEGREESELEANRAMIEAAEEVPSLRHLSSRTLYELHEAIMPVTSPAVGEPRNVQVWIGPPGSNMANATYVPPPPSEVSVQLGELLAAWNSRYPQLLTADSDERLDAIADFHFDLLRIHPFLDGNQRLAWLVAAIQAKELMNYRPQVILAPAADGARTAVDACVFSGDRAGCRAEMRTLITEASRAGREEGNLAPASPDAGSTDTRS